MVVGLRPWYSVTWEDGKLRKRNILQQDVKILRGKLYDADDSVVGLWPWYSCKSMSAVVKLLEI